MSDLPRRLDKMLKEGTFKPLGWDKLIEGVELVFDPCNEGCELKGMEHMQSALSLMSGLFMMTPSLHEAQGYAAILLGLQEISIHNLHADHPVDKKQVVDFVSLVVDRINEGTKSLLSPRM